jgi:hypothetical protein
VWRPGISKVQVEMYRIDARGAPRGRPSPAFGSTPTPAQIRTWMTDTSAYPTPPGSGNVYAREFLDRLFPLDDRCGDATDSACLAAAPYLGDAVTVAKPLVRYRVHGGNRSGLRADPSRSPGRSSVPVSAIGWRRRTRDVARVPVVTTTSGPCGGGGISCRCGWRSSVWWTACHRLRVTGVRG